MAGLRLDTAGPISPSLIHYKDQMPNALPRPRVGSDKKGAQPTTPRPPMATSSTSTAPTPMPVPQPIISDPTRQAGMVGVPMGTTLNDQFYMGFQGQSPGSTVYSALDALMALIAGDPVQAELMKRRSAMLQRGIDPNTIDTATITPMKSGGMVTGPTVLHVGERKPKASDKMAVDEFVYADPGTDGTVIVAPRPKDKPPTMKTAAEAIAAKAMEMAGHRMMNAQEGAVVDPEMFQGSDLLTALLTMMQGLGPTFAVDVPKVQTSLFDLLGAFVPGVYGVTDPAEFRAGIGNALSTGQGMFQTLPSKQLDLQAELGRRQAALAEQQFRTSRELRGLSAVPGAGQVPSLI